MELIVEAESEVIRGLELLTTHPISCQNVEIASRNEIKEDWSQTLALIAIDRL